MTCGTPCLVTDVGDVAQIMGDAGWVCRRVIPLPWMRQLQGRLVLKLMPINPLSVASLLGAGLKKASALNGWSMRTLNAGPEW